MRQQRERYVSVPSIPLSELIVVQADFPFGLLKAIFYGPSAAHNPDQLSGRRLFRPVRQVVGELVRIVDLARSEEHTSELQSRQYLVCRLLLEKKKKR